MNGLRRHEAQKHKEYNTPPVSISSLEVPEFLLRQFKQEIISGFGVVTKIIVVEEDGRNLF
jgi:hypothetical protein